MTETEASLSPQICGMIIAIISVNVKITVVSTSMTWLPLLEIIIYEGAFALGLAYIPIFLTGEMFALNIKIPAASLVNIISSIITIFIKVTFKWIWNIAGIYTTFWTQAICSVVGSLIFFRLHLKLRGKFSKKFKKIFARDIKET